MKSFLCLFYLWVGCCTVLLYGQSSTLSSADISFEFVSTGVTGTLSGFKSESRIDLYNLQNSLIKGSVASKTLDTNNGLRNWSLRSGKYFDVDDFPAISFESNTIVLNGDQLLVSGDLTIKNTVKPVSISFLKHQNTLVGTFSLNAADYGIKVKRKREDNLVNVKMVFTITP